MLATRSVILTLNSLVEPLPISDRVIAEIQLLSQIAQANGSLVTLQDIVALTHINLTREEIETHWPNVPQLSSRFELRDGFVHDRAFSPRAIDIDGSIVKETEKRRRAEGYAVAAGAIAPFFRGKEASLVAISGSTSYQSVSQADDLDFFCVTRPGFLWIFLVKSMLLSRALRLFRRNTPRICFSYAVDEEYAAREFASSNDPLFARDALTTVVVHGEEVYQGLLKKSSWMSEYYPQLFKHRARDQNMNEGFAAPSTPSSSVKFFNQLLHFIVGNYIATKSAMLNRKFRRLGKSSSLFRLRVGIDHFILESERYSQLRALYTSLSENRSQTSPVKPIQV